MVDGNEYIFPNIKELVDYLLNTESTELSLDLSRHNAPTMYIPQIKPIFYPYSRHNVVEPNDIRYPLSAFFNDASSDKFNDYPLVRDN